MQVAAAVEAATLRGNVVVRWQCSGSAAAVQRQYSGSEALYLAAVVEFCGGGSGSGSFTGDGSGNGGS